MATTPTNVPAPKTNRLGLAVLDPFNGQVQFVFVMFRLAFVLGTPVRQDP